MHKYAMELAVGDRFMMAGTIYQVIQYYQVADDDMIKIAFQAVDDRVNSGHMTIWKEVLFHLW